MAVVPNFVKVAGLETKMHLQYTPYIFLIAISAVLSAALTIVAWRRHEVPAAKAFGFLNLAVFEWSLLYAVELSTSDLPLQTACAKLEYFGIVGLSLAWFLFAVIYTGRERWLTRRKLAALAVLPSITLLMVWTNDWHHLFWTQIASSSFDSVSLFVPIHGAWFWVHTAYSYALILGGSVLILQNLARAPRLYRGQGVILFISVLAPWVGNAIYLSGLSPFPYLDLTPIAFTVTGVALAWDLARYQLLNLVPVARDLVIESMDDAVLVLDARNRIVDLNPAAQQLLRHPATEVIGLTIQETLSEWREQLERYFEIPRAHEQVSLYEGAAQRWFDLRISPMCNPEGKLTGRLVVVREVTERKRAEKTRAATYRISEAAHAAPNLNELFLSTHIIVAELIPAGSFYIALYDPVENRLSFPYWADEHDAVPAPAPPGKGLTAYVLRTGEPLLADPSVFEDLVRRGQVEEIGLSATDWLGVPLKTDSQTIGVLVVQTYAERRLGDEEQKILVFASEQVAMSIERVRAEEALRRARDELEIRVQERTMELATLYDLSRTLAAAAPSIDPILYQVARHAVKMIQVTLARVLLIEDDQLAVRAI
ncbi:MAG TPA: histidine kinase N-terminal 7TM domain-containing protein, partial [Anaerolineae bacterium]